MNEFFVTYKEGETVYRQGDAGELMYIIEDGRIEITKRNGDEERTIAHLEQGDFFGEMSLLDDEPREASARASTDTQLLRIDKNTFDQMLRQQPEIAIRILRKLARRLRSLEVSPPAAVATAVMGKVEPPPAGAAPAGAARRYALRSETGDVIVLPEKPEITVGRPDASAGTTPDIDLTKLDDNRSVSRRHARLQHRDGAYFVSGEPGAANGTFVNHARIPAGTSARLAENDIVGFGHVLMTFRAVDEPGERP